MWHERTGRIRKQILLGEDKMKKCKDCGSTKNLTKINEKPTYVCLKCWDEKGYEYDPTPWW